jgi:heat shock protein HslJ
VGCKTSAGTQGSEKVSTQVTENITGKYWKLIEINGSPVAVSEDSNREPHIILNEEARRVTGSSGCNTFSGSYVLSAGNRIKFMPVAATMKACLNMDVESALFNVFEQADNYTLSDDGKFLSLNRARMAPLARFEVVYM